MTLRNEKGFTIPELLVAAGLTLIVLAAFGAVFRMQSHTAKAQEYRLEAQEYTRAVLDMMVREMRNTGYFPTGTPCPSTNGIVAAGAQNFQFVYDLDFNGTCVSANENVTYAYDSTNKNITRNGTALTDGNVTALQFKYYPQQTSGTPPPPFCVSTGNPAGCSGTLNLATVQRVLISLTVQSKSADTTFSGQASTTMVSNAELRNRGLP